MYSITSSAVAISGLSGDRLEKNVQPRIQFNNIAHLAANQSSMNNQVSSTVKLHRYLLARHAKLIISSSETLPILALLFVQSRLKYIAQRTSAQKDKKPVQA
jgi:hypothetical protein